MATTNIFEAAPTNPFCFVGDGTLLDSSEKLGSGSYGIVLLCKLSKINARSLGLPAGRYAIKVCCWCDHSLSDARQILDGSNEPERVRLKCPGFCSGSVLRECSIAKTLERSNEHVLTILRVLRNPEYDSAILLMNLECGVTISKYFETFGLRNNPKLMDTDRNLKIALYGAFKGLRSLHRRGMTHADIKVRKNSKFWLPDVGEIFSSREIT